jgi:hypothetical protein
MVQYVRFLGPKSEFFWLLDVSKVRTFSSGTGPSLSCMPIKCVCRPKEGPCNGLFSELACLMSGIFLRACMPCVRHFSHSLHAMCQASFSELACAVFVIFLRACMPCVRHFFQSLHALCLSSFSALACPVSGIFLRAFVGP